MRHSVMPSWFSTWAPGQALDSAANAAADLAAGAAGLLRVGSSEGLGPRLDQILAAFRQQHPSAIVQLSVGTTPAKLAAVAAGDLGGWCFRVSPTRLT